MSLGFVYLFRSENGLYKIGRSEAPLRRLSEFAAFPVAVEFVHQIQTDDMGWLEASLHRKYAGQRVRGEWFALSVTDVAGLCAIEAQDRPAEPEEESTRPTGPAMPTVKIDAEVYRLVRTVAAWRGVSVAEYLSDVVAPVIRKELKKMNREADAQADSGEAEG
jgi:hypothetical protein